VTVDGLTLLLSSSTASTEVPSVFKCRSVLRGTGVALSDTVLGWSSAVAAPKVEDLVGLGFDRFRNGPIKVVEWKRFCIGHEPCILRNPTEIC
jgi:hypothetical protein